MDFGHSRFKIENYGKKCHNIGAEYEKKKHQKKKKGLRSDVHK